MFGHNRINNELPYEYSSDFPTHFSTSQTLPSPPLFLPPLAIPGEPDFSVSGCSSYGGSPTSITYSPTLIQRSVSSLSLQKNMEVYSPMQSLSPPAYYETETSSVRKALSTGDLQGVNVAQQSQRSSSMLVNENSIIESMNRASPYSPEEKKERIERYRSKRNLRNFNKKIKYECRKTLADRRPRIRGRFARNDEIEKTSQSQWDHAGVEEDEEEDDNWVNFLDALSTNLMP
ncbi:hypothetical protein CDL12_27554 [Handroanthus impetiginosus]|uniref:CCT domain-containing protein n=1 Tax=Handroanthus impetiginosus TaxID=429701 RepID=A0A2G9G3Q6_9LAMI|nr:hypothetical protein CDL12_27554 [Handroanthus impetiginosus]